MQAVRLGGKGLRVGKERQAHRHNIAGRTMQSSRDRGRQAERDRQDIQAGRETGRQQPCRQRHRRRRMQR
jgi:hypothetical protein